MDQVCSQLSLVTVDASPAPPPATYSSASEAVPVFSHEPYIPIPARYSGELGGCEGFLYKSSLVDQRD